ncbi:MAG: acylneuraminate cytidylyltransferase family protein [Bacteroidia bacterium]|nr:acylneuraminate cytidylyltransferase family protein [Bacteroidia bacterium]
MGVIPARGGSKRVPRKNLKLLNGKPLIMYTIEQALKCNRLNHVFVSTDDDEIAEVARAAGAKVPFMRPKELAQDKSSDFEVFDHFVQTMQADHNIDIDVLVNLRPTSPFRLPEDIDTVIDLLIQQNADSVRTVCRSEGIYHPYWMYTKENSGAASSFLPGISVKEYYQSQLLPPVYRLNGMVDAIRTGVMKEGDLYGTNMYLHETPENRAVDIDTMEDFEFAEFLMKKRNV